MAVISPTDILVLIYKTEYYIINKEYDTLLQKEYGITFVNEKAANKLQCLKMLLKALKYQYLFDPTTEVAARLYNKVQSYIGLNLDTLPEVNTGLIVYDANDINFIFVGTVYIATYQELMDNLPQDYDKVISVKVFNEFFANFNFDVRIYKEFITITDGLVITHNLATPYIDVSFIDSNGPIYCDYEITSNNSITLNSNVTIPSVRLTVLG